MGDAQTSDYPLYVICIRIWNPSGSKHQANIKYWWIKQSENHVCGKFLISEEPDVCASEINANNVSSLPALPTEILSTALSFRLLPIAGFLEGFRRALPVRRCTTPSQRSRSRIWPRSTRCRAALQTKFPSSLPICCLLVGFLLTAHQSRYSIVDEVSSLPVSRPMAANGGQRAPDC